MNYQIPHRGRSARCLFALALVTLFGTVAVAQQTAARPDRGVMPGGNYQVSDIENISLQNGNVNLEIPLVALPPVAGGKLSWVIKAHYNSKLWDLTRTQLDAADMEWEPYVVDNPQLSERGGWRISGQYMIEIRPASWDFDYAMPPWDAIPYNEYQLLVNYNWYKVVLVMPDGSEHELRPVDYSAAADGTGLTFLHGYFNVSPYTHGTMRYYSFDGSYLHATVNTNGTGWTVYLPDGTKVVQTTDGIQRIQDTNGNKIKIYSDTNGTHYQDEQTGREIRHGADGKIWYQTVEGVSQSIDIIWGTTTVQGQVYKVNDWIPSQINPRPCVRNSEINVEMQVIREIILPPTEPAQAQRRFTFSYNSDATESATNSVRWSCDTTFQDYTRQVSKGWGSLSRIVTPSDAVIDYSYSLDSGIPFAHLPFFTDQIAEESITRKKLTHDGIFDVWTYSVINETATVTAPDGGTVEERKYAHSPGYGLAFGKAGLVFRSTRPFIRIDRHWSDLIFSGASTNSPGGPVSFNPVVDFEYTTLLDAAGNQLKMSAKAFQFDYNGNLMQTTEYDWFDPTSVSRDAQGIPTGVPGSATVLRTTSNTFYNPAISSSSGNVYAKRSLSTGLPLILNAMQQTTTGASTAQLSYDGYAYGTAPTIGNLTSKKVWDDVDNKWITTSQTYGLYGNLATATDGRGKVTTFYYDDATHAVPNRVVVDPQNGTGTQTTTTEFDYYTGLVTSQTDANNQVSTIDYTNQLLPGSIDPFGRPGVTIGPDMGGGVNHRTTTTYVDSARQVIVAADLNAENDKLLKTRTTADMLGRVILSEQTEDGTNYTITAQKAYDMVHNVTYSSNPRRSTSSATDGWTRATSDTGGRVIEVATFSGAAQPPFSGTNGNWTGSVATSYSANEVTVTDQAGKQRKSLSNALGQLTSVFEDPAGLNYQTSYDYDVLGNLRHVYQGSQTRTFTYDTLSRLRTAANPESGTITYAYDDNGNLTSKVDARSITTSYAYDSLNRATSRSYSDGTPTVTYTYDSASVANSKGRLTSVSSSVSATNYTAYNARGSITATSQVTDGQTYSMSHVYNLAGGQTSMTYPSGRVITSGYDGGGRLAGVRDQSSGVYYAGAASTDATNRMQYAPQGAVSVMKLGNGLWEHTNFNARLQLTEIGLGTTSTSSSTMGLTYNYGTTNNNGNLQSASYSGGGLSYTQNFGYDVLNRLTTSNENSGSSWSQTNSYDRYGNRSIVGGLLTFNAANNRITTSGYAYDPVGNLTNDTIHTYGFDAENKIKTVDGVNDVYRYDGDGNRVRKNFALGEKVRMVYSGGQLLAEYDLSNGALKKECVYGAKGLIATIEPSTGTRYTTSDHLGSPRVVTNSSAAVVSRHDYMPFGVEIGVGVGGRTTGMGYGATDGVRQKFTQKERDNETGLDYFLARYYSSTQGRFTGSDSFDPSFERQQSGDSQAERQFRSYLHDPRRWNKYSYALNNPLGIVDPDGRQGKEIAKAGVELIEALSHGLSAFAGGAVAQQVAVAVTRTILAEAFGPNIEVRQGGLNAREFGFAKEVSQFTQSNFVGTPKHQPGFDGILTAPGSYTDVRGVASLTETSRGNARVLLDLAEDKQTSAKNAGNKNVDLFIKATNIDSKAALDFIQKGSGFTNVTSGGTIRSINIFTSDNKVVTISQGAVKTCDTKGKCQ